MKILVVGGGGREHAIIRALKKSPDCGDIWCAPGNGGIGYDATCKNIPATDVDAMVAFAKAEAFDYVVVAQDDPLALGMVDALAKVGIPAFGPDAAAARIEASKVFSKDLMKKYGIPTAGYETFDDPAKVMEYIKAEGKYPVVIKADGLALGKGVLICENEEQAADGVKEIMLDKKFGASGNHVVVEEFLTGPEVSVLSFTDGKVVKPMVSSMDHKRANDHDTGLNTGGMGTIAPNPYYTPEVAAECMEKIFLPTIHTMKHEKSRVKHNYGCVYMQTAAASIAKALDIESKGITLLSPVFDLDFGDNRVDTLLLHGAESEPARLAEFMAGVFEIVQVVGIVDNALEVALVVAHLHA